MSNSNKVWVILTIVLVVVIGVLTYLWRSSVIEITNKENLYYAIQDTLHQTRNKLGQQVTQTALIQQSSDKDFLKLKSKDSTIIELQAEVKANKKKLGASGSITDIGTVTKGSFSGKTNTITVHDTVRSGNVIYLYPEYKSHITKGQWISADITANKDSTTFSPMIYNKYSVLLSGDVKNPIVQIVDLNPYTITTDLKSYRVTNTLRDKTWGLGIQVGYGGNLYKGVVTVAPYIGIGITKILIRW